MPPPAPTKPHIKPIIIPHSTDCTAAVFLSFFIILLSAAVTGFTRNLTPSREVITTENPPIAVPGRSEAMKLPARVKHSTDIIIITPLRISRFLFFPYVYAEAAEAKTSEARAIPTA